MQDIYVTGNDPLMRTPSYSNPSDLDLEIIRLQQAQQQLEQKRQQLQQVQIQPQQSQSPVWDEIDRITSELSESEFSMLNENEEFQKSQNLVMNILQQEYMKIMRPIVERSPEGKKALENHLSILKKWKKTISEDANKSLMLFQEYTEKYSNMTYAEFLKMKKEQKG